MQDSPDQFQKRRSLSLAVKGVAGPMEQKKVNVDRMHHPEKYKAISEELPVVVPARLPGRLCSGVVFDHLDHNGSLQVWFVKGHGKEELPENEHKLLYSKNCYIFCYKINLPGGMKKYIIYYWHGRR